MRFKLLLFFLGLILSAASRLSARLRGQLSRDMTVIIASYDGVARAFTIKDRKISTSSRVPAEATLKVYFRTAAIGFRIFLAPNAIDQIVDGFGTGDVVCEGEAAHILWFYELTMGLLPWRKKPIDIWPDSYTAPNKNHKVSDRIIREPALESLDPISLDAHKQREKTILWGVGRGATPWGKVKRHKIVVELDASMENQA